MKMNRKKGLLSSVLIVISGLVGIFSMEGIEQGQVVACIVSVVLFLSAHWLCLWAVAKDRKNENQDKKVSSMVYWIFPVVSLLESLFLVGTTQQMAIPKGFYFCGIGFLVVLLGNYFPKCRQNNIIGVRTTWTLASEENWNMTHRLAGKVWVAGGLVIMLVGILPIEQSILLSIVVVFALVMVPVIYSWKYYKKQKDKMQ